MISYLKGEIMYRGEGFVVLLCGSIGYEVYLPGNRAYNYFEGQEAAFCTYLYKEGVISSIIFFNKSPSICIVLFLS